VPTADSLAQHATLRILTLKQCSLVAALLEHLLSTATQGSALDIKLVRCGCGRSKWEAPATVHAKVAAQRGCHNTPWINATMPPEVAAELLYLRQIVQDRG
jgi:hypothetical protein